MGKPDPRHGDARDDHVPGPDPIGADGRRQRASRRIAVGSVCACCGETDPVVLKGTRSIIEAHHIAGRANDPNTTADLCLNCHRKQTNLIRDLGVQLAEDPERHLLDKLVAWLRGLAVFCQQLADQLLENAHRLEDLVSQLDDHHPGWRTR